MTDRDEILRLRREVFAAADPTAAAALFDQLIQAEGEAPPPASPPGSGEPLLKVGSTLEGTLAEMPGFRADAHIRTTFVPTALAHLLLEDKNPLVSVTLRNQTDGAVVCRTKVWVDGYSATAVKTQPVRRGAGEVTVSLLPTFFPRAIRDLTEITAATVHVTIDLLDGKDLVESTGRVWLLPPHSAILQSRDPKTGTTIDLRRYLAAYVTPNDPSVIAFLRTAADLHPKGMLVGDRNTPAADIREQVRAVYGALKSVNITYVNSLVSFLPEAGLSGQRVRLPRESLEDHQANCLDGVLLFASLLEAASLNPVFVFVPGHAVVGWEKKRDANEWDYLETTMIGSADFDAATASGDTLEKKYRNAGLLDAFPLRALRKEGLFPLA